MHTKQISFGSISLGNSLVTGKSGRCGGVPENPMVGWKTQRGGRGVWGSEP